MANRVFLARRLCMHTSLVTAAIFFSVAATARQPPAVFSEAAVSSLDRLLSAPRHALAASSMTSPARDQKGYVFHRRGSLRQLEQNAVEQESNAESADASDMTASSQQDDTEAHADEAHPAVAGSEGAEADAPSGADAAPGADESADQGGAAQSSETDTGATTGASDPAPLHADGTAATTAGTDDAAADSTSSSTDETATEGTQTTDTEQGAATTNTSADSSAAGGDVTGDKSGDADEAHADSTDDATVTAQGTSTENSSEGKSSGGESSGKNQTAFLEFTLKHMAEGDPDSAEAFTMIPIFEKGALTGPFEHCPTTSALDSPVSNDSSDCYSDGAYMDRIAFQFVYLPNNRDYKIKQPEVHTTSESGVEPEVRDFRNDRATGVGTFHVLYRCKRDAPEKSFVSLHIQVTEDRSIDTIWTKTCGHGRYEHLLFGFRTHDQSLNFFNADGTYGKEEQKMLEVGPLDTSTELVVQLKPPAEQVEFLQPNLSSDNEDVQVSLRGAISAATLSSDIETKFSVLYECHATATSLVHFSLPIPPWDNITTTWRKDCGGSHSQALLIGTTGSNSYDVMQSGELTSEFNVSADADIDEVSGRVFIVPGNVHTKKFYLTNSDDTSDIQIQTISTTMSDPDVVSTQVASGTFSGSYIPPDGATIARKETKSLALRFICKRTGRSIVLVTLPTLRYKNVEFGFIKECFEPHVYRHSGFLSTAGSLMWALLTLLICGGTGVWFYVRRRAGIKYAAVPTSDNAIP